MKKSTDFSLRRRLLALCSAALLAACGGGGGDNGNATATTPPPSGTGTAQPTVAITSSAPSVTSGQPVTLTWNAQGTGAANCTASGAWSGQLATSGSQQVTPPASAGATATYALTCGSIINSVVVGVSAPVNTVAVTVDRGPSGANAFNIPFVSVTVCRPGSTTACQTIDHVMVDTASYGLRLIAPLAPALGLPAVKSSSGAEVGECGQFVSGYTWGAIAQADVKLGGEVAPAQSIQIIGQAPGGVSSAPSACTGTGGDLGTVAGLGANGILGVGLFKEDCGTACVNSAPDATYYACANGSCTPTSMPLAKQVSNPVGGFASDNNGVVLALPSVTTAGSTGLTGTLTFGIGTQANNALGAATVFRADQNGNFTTIYKGVRMSASFIDSGSNGLYFTDNTIPTCSNKDFYCPTRPLTLSATMEGFGGTPSTAIAFALQSIDALPDAIIAGPVGGPNGTGKNGASDSFDWGLPFFFGRKVFVGMESATTDPYWAF